MEKAKYSISDKVQIAVFFLFGFFSTIPIIEIPIAGRYFSVFSLFLLLSVVLLVFHFNANKVICGKAGRSYLNWLVISLLSCFVGYIYFHGKTEWENASVSYIAKILIYIVLYLLIKCTSYNDCVSPIVSGLISGMVANILWASLEGVIFYISGVSITNVIFKSYIVRHDVRYGQLALITDGGIRSGGLNGDPANIGFFATVTAIYSLRTKKPWILVASLIATFASVSLISVIGIVFAVVTEFLKNKGFRARSLIMVAALFFCVSVVIVIALFMPSTIIGKMLNMLVERIKLKGEIASTSVRTLYFVYFIPAAIMSPLSLLIGTGFGTSSYAYLINTAIEHDFYPYDPECTYFAYFFDCGLIGLIMFILCMIRIGSKLRELQIEDSKYVKHYACFCGMLLVMWGYHYIVYAPMMIITICLCVVADEEKNKSKSHGKLLRSDAMRS